MTDLIRIERDGRVAQLVLDRPRKLNAMNDEVLEGFSAAVAELGADRGVSVVVISGAGGNFSVGFDVDSGHTGTDTYPDWESLRRDIERWLAVWDAPKPFLTAVEGYCMGGATMLSVCADITVVSEDAVIGWPSLPLGGGLLSPASAWLIGPKKARELSYVAGSRLTGTEAAALGWANHAVPAGQALDRALELAGLISRTPPDLLRIKKLALNRVAEQQGFRESILAGAEWDALAHTAPGARRMTGKVAELGLKGAVSWFGSEDNR